MRRTRRISRWAPAPSWRWRMRSSWRAASASSPRDLAQALRDYEAVRSIEVLKIQNAARNSTEWFENVRALRPPAARAVRLFAADAQPAHQPREPAAARQGLCGGLRGLDRRAMRAFAARRCSIPSRRCSRPSRLRGITLKNRVVVSPMAQYSCVDGLPADYHLVHLGARAMGGAGMVVAEMTCPTPDARITPGCPGPVERGSSAMAGSASSTSCTPAQRREDRHAAGARRRQGLDPRAVGRRGPAAGRRQLAADLGLAAAVPGRRERLVARDDARRHGPGARRLRAQHRAGGAGGLRLAGAALRPRLPAVQLHLAADQPAHRRIRRRRWRTACAIRWKCSAPCARRGPSTCRCRCASRRTTGSKAASRRTTPWRSPGPSRRRAPT